MDKTIDKTIDKKEPPESFGVFKPVNHTVIAFRAEADMPAVVQAFRGRGFESKALMSYDPEEMLKFVLAQEQSASPLAAFGYESRLIQLHRALAEQGCHFLIVHTPEDEQAELAADLARAHKAVAAQRYGRFVIEEVIVMPAEPGMEEALAAQAPPR